MIRLMMRNRLRARKKAMQGESKLYGHLRKVLSASMKKPMDPGLYLQVTIVLFILLFFIGLQNVSIFSAAVISVVISAMPYLLLRVRLESIRRKGSYEGERLITEFLNQYRICTGNIYRTIEQVVVVSAGTKICNRMLFQLLVEIRNTGDPERIKNASVRFSYGINTNWSRMLANNIRLAAENGTDITLALEDILIQLREARTMIEERKRMNAEASRMTIFLSPMLYCGTMFMSVKYLDLTLFKLIKNQFYTEQGFLLLLLIVFTFLINLMLIEFVNNQRFDY